MNEKSWKSFIFIALGFFVGQGAMFIAQSYLAINEQFEIIATVGIGLGILSFLQWIADSGGVLLIQNYYVKSRDEVWIYYISRIFISLFLCCLYKIILLVWSPKTEVVDILNFGYVVILVGALNFSGVADYLGKNKFIGLFAGAPWFFSSISLAYCYSINSSEIYKSVGLFFFLGMVLSLFVQLTLLKNDIMKDVLFFKNSMGFLNKFKRALVESLFYNVNFFSNQIYGRVIPILIEKMVSAPVAGAFVYGRHIVNIFGQLLMFSRRVEFKHMVIVTDRKVDFILIKSILLKQSNSYFINLFCFLFIFIIDIVDRYRDIGNLGQSLQVMYYLAFALIFFNFSSFLSQFFIANGMSGSSALIQSITVIPTSILVIYLISFWGIYAVYIGEIFLYCSRILIYTYIIFSKGNSGDAVEKV